jgi:hypothetical protein
MSAGLIATRLSLQGRGRETWRLRRLVAAGEGTALSLAADAAGPSPPRGEGQ